ncbi:MAG: Iron-sulfur cluster assembly accessory protein [Alphaproteobacteria bacterium]|jgi:iron-sulfur cluster insertion protein|nr:Iron-sulfur cluster assembly accessory protein [Alphaproteobacteria bacterium]
MTGLDRADAGNRPELQPVIVTESAAKRIATLMSREGNPDLFLRVAVLGGGCSGFQYTFNFDDARTEDDLVIARDGAVVVIDSTSLDLLRGSQIDFVEDMVGSAFAVKNPNASSSCGCGNSFSV